MQNKRTAAEIGALAACALRMEAGATPKPGLVDRENSGAHRDMDYPLFLASSAALQPYFTACAQAGAEGSGKEPQALVPGLRRMGRWGETAMYAATKGVNTHKGLVFSMGILCCALGMLTAGGTGGRMPDTDAGGTGGSDQRPVRGGYAGTGRKADMENRLQALCAQLSAALLQQDPAAGTHGLQVRGDAGVGGVRAEALSGFDSVFHTGLPVLRQARSDGHPLMEAMIKALLALMAGAEDSNAAYRGGAEGLAFVRTRAAELLEAADLRTEAGLEMVRDFDRACTRRNLSPGGSADLLALTVMAHLFFDEEKEV